MIRSFSFRYGDNTGQREWYRVENDDRAICVRIDKTDGETFFAEVEQGFLEELEEMAAAARLAEWNGFHDIDTCLCSGDSWVLHIFDALSEEKEIHAMGHSAYPEGFSAGRKAIQDFFDAHFGGRSGH